MKVKTILTAIKKCEVNPEACVTEEVLKFYDVLTILVNYSWTINIEEIKDD